MEENKQSSLYDCLLEDKNRNSNRVH